MKLSNIFFQRIISCTVLISLLGILCLEVESGILLKRGTELRPAKPVHFAMLSPILEENDKDSYDTGVSLLNEIIVTDTYTCIYKRQESHTTKREHLKASFPSRNLYVTYRSFRI